MTEPGVRERLLAAAVELFADRGYEVASVQDVVEAAGVTKGAFYHYFGSKSDVLYEIYCDLLALQAQRLDGFVDGDGPADVRLHAAAVDVVLTAYAHRDAFTVFVRSMNQLDETNAKAIRTSRRAYHNRFCALIGQGQESGVFRRDVAADVAAHGFLGAAHQIPSWFKPGGRLSIEQVAEQLVALLLDGLHAQPASMRRSQRATR